LIFPKANDGSSSITGVETSCDLDRYYAADLFRGPSAWFSFGLLRVRAQFYLMLQKIAGHAETYRRIGIAEAKGGPTIDVVERTVTIV
jgi:hypothetical protein